MAGVVVTTTGLRVAMPDAEASRVGGRVWLIGAGPGDPQLITVTGQRLIAAADAVVHDRLVHPELLALADPRAQVIDVGKTGHGPAFPQREINALLVRLARDGLSVVRLKGGDPFVFGRGGEEALALSAAGVPFEVVPGVTAGVAGPACAGIPITHRGIARTVAFVTGHEDGDAGGPPTDWTAVARLDTAVVFMAGRTAQETAACLIRAGRPGGTPAAVVVDASLATQEVRLTDLAALARSGAPPCDGRPVLLVVGSAVALAPALRCEATGVEPPVGGLSTSVYPALMHASGTSGPLGHASCAPRPPGLAGLPACHPEGSHAPARSGRKRGRTASPQRRRAVRDRRA